MKKTVSLFLLFLGHSAWKVLLLLAAMAGAELALFRALAPDPAANTLEDCLLACGTPLRVAVLAAFVLLCLLLLTDRSKGKHRLRYTLDRLSVPPRQILVCQAVYALLAWLLFWAVQAVTLLGCCWLYQKQGGTLGPQTLYLASWRDPLLHSFLPMEETSRLARDLILAVCLACTGACSSAQLRRQHKPVAFPALGCFTAAAFVQPMGYGTMDLILSLVALAITALALSSARSLEKEEDYHETLSSD